MGSKYARLKGKIPEQPTERSQALEELLAEYRGLTLAELTALYNDKVKVGEDLATKVKANNVRIEALDIVIRRWLSTKDADSVGMAGFTWSEKFEPYPVAEDTASIVTYFKENGLESQLELSATELAGRLKKYVKEESLANEFVIVEKEIEDPDAPDGKRKVTEVRSRIPGVRIFLKGGLSRVKSKGATA